MKNLHRGEHPGHKEQSINKMQTFSPSLLRGSEPIAPIDRASGPAEAPGPLLSGNTGPLVPLSVGPPHATLPKGLGSHPCPSPHGMHTYVKIADARVTAARAFVRSLNILLKYARLYGFEHTRTAGQFRTAWSELGTAVSSDTAAGLLLGATGSQLLLDGVPLAAAPAERNFAQLLSAAGLARIYFSPKVTPDDLNRFARAFPTGGAKPSVLAEQLKAALDGVSGIRINEIRFVAEDAGLADAKMAAQLTARTLGADAAQFKAWLNDPQKLLQLIAAAEGSRGGAQGSGGGGGAPGGLEGAGGSGRLGSKEDEMDAVLRVLTRLGQLSSQPGAEPQPAMLQQQMSTLPEQAQGMIRQALAALAAQAPTGRPDDPMLPRLAEHLAIRFALERYERGEVRVNAVRQMLDRMGQEIDSLRKILGSHEEKMTGAGMMVESHVEILDRRFWAAVPESGKQAVLLSPEAWCVPPRNIRQYVEELRRRGDTGLANKILTQYAGCVTHTQAEARRKTAIGLSELAEVYGAGDPRALIEAIRQAGLQLSLERDAELQSLVSASFVRLTQEAGTQRCYAAMQQALASLDSVENQRPAFAQSVRPRIGVESRLPEFIEEALRAERIPEGLADILRLMARPAVDLLVGRLNRCGYRRDCDRLVELAREVGPDSVSYLRETLRAGPPAEAGETAGLLSRLDSAALEQWLPTRLRDLQRSAHDRVVRQLAGCGAPERGGMLLAILEGLDPLIQPLALDEIGMSGDTSGVAKLVRLADTNLPGAGGPYLRLKAIEALGRLRLAAADAVLRRIAETKQMWRWVHPSELRIAAIQALERFDAGVQEFVSRSGLNQMDLSAALAPLDPVADSPWFRQRRYQRIRLAQPLAAATINLRDNCHMEIKALSLSGGLAAFDKHMVPGTIVSLKLGGGMRPIRAQAIIRDAHGWGASRLRALAK